jgi:hypothetical protein
MNPKIRQCLDAIVCITVIIAGIYAFAFVSGSAIWIFIQASGLQ